MFGLIKNTPTSSARDNAFPFVSTTTRERALAETSRRSLEEAEALPGEDSRSFADYQRDYF